MSLSDEELVLIMFNQNFKPLNGCGRPKKKKLSKKQKEYNEIWKFLIILCVGGITFMVLLNSFLGQ